MLTVSVIINTYNRAPYLRRLLAGLAHLRGVEFEVVVVNGPSTDETASVLKQYEGLVKVVTYNGRNLSVSRNLGIAAAAGDLIAFIDDDALPADKNWLYRFVNVFEEDTDRNTAAVGGPVLWFDTEVLEYDGGLVSQYSFHEFHKTNQDRKSPDGSAWVLRVPGGNSAYVRGKLVYVGGFDETYQYYNDETDLCFRLAKAGYEIKHISENKIRHYSAASERRVNYYDRNWDVITKSDTYFALKNAQDAPLLRLIKALRFAPQKHFVREVDGFIKSRLISRLHWLRIKRLWLSGLLSGLWAGLTQKRKLGNFQTPPPPFLPFLSNKAASPMRIALITSTIPGQPGFGGVGRYTFDLAHGLHQRGHEVHIICRDENPIHYQSLNFIIHGISNAQIEAVNIQDSRPILKKNLAFSIAVEKKLAALYSQGVEFDVVHASNWDAEPVALIREQIYPLALMLVTPLAQVIQTEKWDVNNDLKACIDLDRWQIEHADVVCVPSKGVLKSYQSLMDIHPEQLSSLEITPLGIIPENLPTAVQPAIQPSNIRRLLFVGRLEWRKGIHTLLEILPDLLQQFPNWECHIVGNDQLLAVNGETFKQIFLRKHNNAAWLNRVIFHGTVSQDELLFHYQSCDLFVAPSLFESFGLIFQEAMQFGKAVVGCHTGGIPEVIENGIEGLLVTPDRPHELRDALAQLMQDDRLRESMGKAGKQRIRERDNYLTMAIQLEKVYQSLIAAKGNECKARRKSSWPRELPLFTSASDLHQKGDWEIREAFPGEFYWHGLPGATLTFEALGGTSLLISALCHDRSGVLQVKVNGQILRYLDLYTPKAQHSQKITIDLPGKVSDLLRVHFLVHSERNPASRASEVWLKQIMAVLP